MKDRVPLYPGRVKLTPVSGQTNVYDLVRADQPQQEGTPLNKASLLTDATAEAIGLTGDPTVDDALATLNGNIITPILNIHTTARVVVTATKGSKVLTATSNSSGLAVLYPNELGTWVLSATISGKAMSVNYEIDTVSVRDVYLTTDLASASWEVISAISEAGLASSYWKVGDKKAITVEGENYEVQIIGFNHDTKTSGGKAGITFQTVKCIIPKMEITVQSSDICIWSRSNVRKRLQDIFNGLDESFKPYIKRVNKITTTTSNSTTTETTSDALFLLSEVEIYGREIYSQVGEGSQYAWFSAGNSEFKTILGETSNIPWWTRSSVKNSRSKGICVGTAASTSPNSDYGNNRKGVPFGFCV